MSVRRRLRALAGMTLAAVGVLVVSTRGEGVTTRTFTLSSASDLAAGTLDRVSVRSDGTVVMGAELARVAPTDAVGSVWSLLDLGDGAVLAGTGTDGRVYRVSGGSATLYAQTDAVVVTSLTRGDDGSVYAGTLPDGKLYRLVAPVAGRPQPPVLVAELPGVQHIWAVAWDATRRAVLCATGPDGKLFAVDPRGAAGSNATVLFDSDEAHLYSLALGPSAAPGGRTVYFGSGGGRAVVYALRGTEARVVARLAGDEVKSLVVQGDALWAASNEFTEPPEAPRRTATSGRLPSPGGPSSARPRPGKGRVYRIAPSGLADARYFNAESHITALEWDARAGEMLAALGAGGRVVALADDRTSRVAFDLDEGAVTALALTGRGRLLGTADTGVFYTLREGVPSGATWHSRVLDGMVPCRWGVLRWRGDGALDWETRSGNSELPDATWSVWQGLDAEGTVLSPQARYLQVRARFGRGADAALRAVTVFYLPENQRAVLTEVTAAAPETKAGDTPRPNALRLAWKVENPDGDTLRYRLRYRGESERAWRPILRNQDFVTGTSHEWSIEGLPEGWYRVEVEASDEASNPDDGVERDRRLSAPVLVDTVAPVVRVSVTGGVVSGEVEDGASALTRLELSLDGGEWRPLRVADGVLDGRRERFSLRLAATARTAGEHSVAVRAADEAGNVGSDSARWRE